jgi:hypothetical protein
MRRVETYHDAGLLHLPAQLITVDRPVVNHLPPVATRRGMIWSPHQGLESLLVKIWSKPQYCLPYMRRTRGVTVNSITVLFVRWPLLKSLTAASRHPCLVTGRP